MAQDSKTKLLIQIHDLIEDTFDLDELRDLCFRLGVKYDNLRGENLSTRIQSLVERMHRQRRLDDLLNFCARLRPKVEWPDPSDPVSLDAAPTPFTTPERNPRQVFLSHARQDADFAHQLAADLRRHKWEVWIAPDSIKPGEKWVDAINRGLAESGIFVLALTPDAVSSPWVHSETNVAIGLQHQNALRFNALRFIPLDLKPAAVPPLWQAYQWIPFQSDYKVGLEELLQELQPEKMEQLDGLYRQLQTAVGRRDWVEGQKLGAEISVLYPDYRETETFMALAQREEARVKRQEAEARVHQGQRQNQRNAISQILRRIPVWGWIGGIVVTVFAVIAYALFLFFQLAGDGSNGRSIATLPGTTIGVEENPILTALADVNVRTGPSLQYVRVGFLLNGEAAEVIGHDPVSGWWKIECPDRVTGTECWVSGEAQYTEVTNGEGVPVVIILSTPMLGFGSTATRQMDGAVMVYVPAGEFMMGSDDGDSDERPIHAVFLDSYWIDRTEVTNVQFAQFVTATEYETTAEQEGGGFTIEGNTLGYADGADWLHPFGPDSDLAGRDVHPVILVSWLDAVAYCEWAGGHLPTEAEWEKAARWDEEEQEVRTYPWGEIIDCNHANYYSDSGCGVGDTTAVGSYPDGASYYGTMDMAGNVMEWVHDWYASDYYRSSPARNPQGPDNGDERVLRGGSWFFSFSINVVRAAARYGVEPGYRALNMGFRCVQE